MLLDQVPIERLVLALKGTDAVFQSTILSSLAARSRRMVEAELQGGGSASEREVADARREIVDIVLKMMASGEIVLPTSRCRHGRTDGVEGPHTWLNDPDKESKTEEATEKKVQDAVEKGNVPFSREAATLASLLGMLVIASFFLASGVGQLNFSLARLIDNAGGWPLENSGDAVRLFEAIGMDVLRLLLPVLAVLTIAGVMSSLLQNSPRLVLDRITPKLSRSVDQPGLEPHLRRQGPGRVSQVHGEAGCRLRAGLPAAAVGPQRRAECHVHGAQRSAVAAPDAWPPGW